MTPIPRPACPPLAAPWTLVPVYVPTWAMTVEYPGRHLVPSAVPSAFRAHEYLSNAWSHPGSPNQLLVAYDDALIVFERFTARPNLRAADALVEAATGQQSVGIPMSMFPLKLRVPLLVDIPVPAEQMRSRPLPAFKPLGVEGEPGHEVRLVASRHGSRPPHLWLEVLVGSRFRTREGEARAFVYLADIRHHAEMAGTAAKDHLEELFESLLLGLEMLRHRHSTQIMWRPLEWESRLLATFCEAPSGRLEITWRAAARKLMEER